jgi:hypothetical protein
MQYVAILSNEQVSALVSWLAKKKDRYCSTAEHSAESKDYAKALSYSAQAVCVLGLIHELQVGLYTLEDETSDKN